MRTLRTVLMFTTCLGMEACSRQEGPMAKFDRFLKSSDTTVDIRVMATMTQPKRQEVFSPDLPSPIKLILGSDKSLFALVGKGLMNSTRKTLDGLHMAHGNMEFEGYTSEVPFCYTELSFASTDISVFHWNDSKIYDPRAYFYAVHYETGPCTEGMPHTCVGIFLGFLFPNRETMRIFKL